MASNGPVDSRRVSRPAAFRLIDVPRYDSVASCRYSSTEYLSKNSGCRKANRSSVSAVNSRSAKKFKRSSPSVSSYGGVVALSKQKALSLSAISAKHVRGPWVFALRRPRTTCGKPHASFRKLVSIFKDRSANHPLTKVLSPVEEELLEREMFVFVPSLLTGDHSNSWSIPSSTSSSHEPFSTQLQSLSQSSSEVTAAACSPSSCSEEDFCSSDAMSFVMHDECYDSVLNFMPCSNEGMFSEAASTYMVYAGDEMRRAERQVEASTEITSAEEYRIDLSDFEPEDNAMEVTEERTKRGLCLRLDYEDVLRAWSDRSCLWADGKRPISSCFLSFS